MTDSQRFPYPLALLLVALALTAAAFIAIYHIDRESLWYDEGWTVWTVYDSPPLPETVRETASYILDSVTGALSRIREYDVHPPLYYVTLDAWRLFMGESALMIRLVSVFWGLFALAGTYNLGRRLFDRQTALMAVLILGSSSFFIYYTREARMYTALMATATLATWAYIRWLEEPSRRQTLVYGLFIALTLYAQYLGILVLAAHGLHLLLVKLTHWVESPRWQTLPLPYLLGLILFAPWIPSMIYQIQVHPGGPLGVALPTDWGTVAALWLVVTSAAGGLFALPFILGRAIPDLANRQIRTHIALLVLWLLVTPVVLLALNDWWIPIFQVRYTLAVLPAGALLVAYALRRVTLPARFIDPQRAQPLRYGMMGAFLMAITLTQLNFPLFYPSVWGEKPPWDKAIQEVVAARDILEPTFTLIPESSIEAYYNRLYGIRQGISIDLAWRDHTPEQVDAIVAKLDDVPSVWAMVPINAVKSWDVVTALARGREIGYRHSVMNMIFYRFDSSETVDFAGLQYQFGDVLAYNTGIGHQLYANIGQPFCVDVTFTALGDLDGSLSAGLHLTQGYGTVRAQWDGGLGTRSAGEQFTLSECINIPDNAPRGPYHLRLAVYNWQTEQRQPVLEVSGGDPEYWWDYIMMARVAVDYAEGEN